MLVALSGVISAAVSPPCRHRGSGSSWLAPGTELSRYPVQHQGAGPQDVPTAKRKNISQTEIKHCLGICEVLLSVMHKIKLSHCFAAVLTG